MVSRDTAVQISTVIVAAIAFLFIPSFLDIPLRSPLGIVLATLWNVSIFGGAHLYLAWRGEDGLVPVESRWRFVVLLGWLAVLWLMWLLVGPEMPISPGTLAPVLGALAIVGLLAYWVAEARDGYTESAQGRI